MLGSWRRLLLQLDRAGTLPRPPAGGGKSLAFQLAPLYRNQITVSLNWSKSAAPTREPAVLPATAVPPASQSRRDQPFSNCVHLVPHGQTHLHMSCSGAASCPGAIVC